MQKEVSESARIEELEEAFLAELRVVGTLFGSSTSAQAQWASNALPAGEWSQHYLASWRRGRREAWRKMAYLAEALQDETCEGQAEWELRMGNLELMAGVEMQDPPASTMSAAL